MDQDHKSGFISIIGRPNVGKSSFLNAVIGQKVAIMSDKPQTTRNKIQGVVTQTDTQFVFIDTPGIHKPKHQLGDFMVKTAQSTLNEVDAIMFMINASQGYGKGDQLIIDWLQKVTTPVFLVINKIDLLSPEHLLALIDQYKTKMDFQEIVPISATQGSNVMHLLDVLKTYLPEGPQYYPDDQITDHPEQFIMSEMIREKVLEFTQEEVPHSIAVKMKLIEQKNDNQVHIHATILTERQSQKGILIGKQGSMLKQIGQKAREDIENLLGTKVYLELWVKVQKDWRNRESQLRYLGYNEDTY